MQTGAHLLGLAWNSRCFTAVVSSSTFIKSANRTGASRTQELPYLEILEPDLFRLGGSGSLSELWLAGCLTGRGGRSALSPPLT